jgi:hypothetical protein
MDQNKTSRVGYLHLRTLVNETEIIKKKLVGESLQEIWSVVRDILTGAHTR